MTILFLNRLNQQWEERIRELKREFPDVKFVTNSNPEERTECLKDADAVVSGKLSEDDIANAPKLKALFVPFTGLNSFPVDKLKQRNIIISNTHANAGVVAERAIALALALLGRITEFHNEMKKGFWHLNDEDNMWTSLQGKRCAVLGTGRIGTNIAGFLKTFGCSITGFGRKSGGDTGNFNEIKTDIFEAVEGSEIIFVCLPLTAETTGIISNDVLSKMKGKYLINVGRGGTIDEDALYGALKDNILKGAAIDVWYNYPRKDNPEPVFPSKHPFHELPNVILSPHNASLTKEAIGAMIDDTAENIRTYLRTGTPKEVAMT